MRGRPGSNRSYGRGPMPAWLQLLEDGYLRALHRRGRRPKTLQAYHYELQDFFQFVTDAGVSNLLELRRPHLEQWQDEVASRKALKTQQVAATAVRGLLKWCADQELAMANPMLYLRLDSPRVPSSDPRPILRHDLKIIQEALMQPDFANMIQLRTRALFWILFSSGSRIGAALSMNRDSIHDRSARVIQKGGRPHTLMFNDLAVASVHDYLGARTDDDPALFIGHHGAGRSQRAGGRLTIGRADATWALLSQALGVGRFSSHQIRHSTATTMLRNHVDGIVVAKVLGHRGLATVMGYTDVDQDQRRAAIDALGIGA
jgi:site-specific recombinase XerD